MWIMVLQGLHVFFGILWFGGSMFSNFVVIPSTNKIDASHANPFLAAYGKMADRYMHPVGALTIVFGFVLGFPLNAWAHLGHAYGNTYLFALILALFVYLWGILMIARNIKKAMTYGIGTPEFIATVDKVKKFAGLELLGFIVLFVMMVLMRYGL